MIHKVDISNGPQFVIASGHAWLPGVYDSERAARYAFRFPDEALRKLQNEVNDKEPTEDKRVISFGMLQTLYQQRKTSSVDECEK